MQEKEFVNGIFAKEFGQYGSVKISIHTNEIEHLKDKDGKVHIVMNKSKGGKLYFIKDTFASKQNTETAQAQESNSNSDDLPF